MTIKSSEQVTQPGDEAARSVAPVPRYEFDINHCFYEDDLPKDITKVMYDEWFAKSRLVDGVRMGPAVNEVKHRSAPVPDAARIIHWLFKSDATATACGLEADGRGCSLVGDLGVNCAECKAAFVGYKFGRADERARSTSSVGDAIKVVDEYRDECAAERNKFNSRERYFSAHDLSICVQACGEIIYRLQSLSVAQPDKEKNDAE